ncbi:hypothetical protein HOC37_03810 [bacterium]|nr:hypothetical protein [bacterium]MBT4552095.1 hypothetical protein [bacterium]MBT7088374.1 hypothetical protein [bacterium]
MQFKNKYLTYFIYFLLVVAILVAGNITLRRYQFENQNHKIEVVLSYQELNKLALLSGQEKPELFSTLKKLGITSIALEENTIADYENNGELTILKGSEIVNKQRIGKAYRFILTHLSANINLKRDKNKYYLVIDRQSTYDRLKNFLQAELFGNIQQNIKWNILEVSDTLEDFQQIGLGISEDAIKEIESFGFTVIPRLKNANRFNDSLLELKFLTLSKIKNPHTLIFAEDSVLGYPLSQNLQKTAQKIKNLNLNFGYIEFAHQKGFSHLALELPSSVLRVFSLSEKQMTNISAKQATEKYLRAAKERGSRILFLHPFFNHYTGQNILEYNLEYFQSVLQGLKELGLSPTSITKPAIQNYQPANQVEILLLSLGVFAALLILTNLFIPLTSLLKIALAFGLFLTGLIFCWVFQYFSFWHNIMALITASIFPALAIISQFPKTFPPTPTLSKKISGLLFYLLKITGITLLGSLLITGLLSKPVFLLSIKSFSGVKISFLSSLILVALYFYLTPARISSFLYVFKRLFFAPARTGPLTAAFFLFMFILIYIIRSGNYINFEIPYFEEWLRSSLERILLVRPRTKEFLIGYPFLIFGFLYAQKNIFVSKNWLWFFNSIGTVALVSLINSFCHLHTPLLISFYRSFLGLVLGIFIGTLLLGFFYALKHFSKKSH